MAIMNLVFPSRATRGRRSRSPAAIAAPAALSATSATSGSSGERLDDRLDRGARPRIHPPPAARLDVRDLANAIKSDTLSVLSFEVGLFGWMALAHCVL